MTNLALAVSYYRPDGVRIEVLRQGDRHSPLFLTPGVTGDPGDLRALAGALETSRAVVALAPEARDANGLRITSIELIAGLSIAALRSMQPAGPYRIGGYSLGGLIAFEMAQQLHAAGETLAAVILIDPDFDEHYWPPAIRLAALARRTFWRLQAIAQRPPGAALGELRSGVARLVKGMGRRVPPDDAPGVGLLQANLFQAMAAYRPRRYVGVVTLICSEGKRYLGCRTAALWEDLASRVETFVAPGDHVSILEDPQALKIIAATIEARLVS